MEMDLEGLGEGSVSKVLALKYEDQRLINRNYKKEREERSSMKLAHENHLLWFGEECEEPQPRVQTCNYTSQVESICCQENSRDH